jgi:hypothetical protein
MLNVSANVSTTHVRLTKSVCWHLLPFSLTFFLAEVRLFFAHKHDELTVDYCVYQIWKWGSRQMWPNSMACFILLGSGICISRYRLYQLPNLYFRHELWHCMITVSYHSYFIKSESLVDETLWPYCTCTSIDLLGTVADLDGGPV